MLESRKEFSPGSKNLSDIKISLKVPDGYASLLTDIRLLKSEGNNPNRMTIKRHEEKNQRRCFRHSKRPE